MELDKGVGTRPTLPAPAPMIDADSAAFWAATCDGRLLLGFCAACGEHFFYPRPLCPLCGAWDATLRESAGLGVVHSWTTVHHGVDEYADAGPYVLAYVTLDEGPMLLTNIVECADGIAINDLVEVVFHRTSTAAALPRFRPVYGGEES